MANIWDISDHREAARALSEQERLLQTIVETEPECVKVVECDGTLVTMNWAGLDMIEADSLDQVRGKCVFGLVAKVDREALCSAHRPRVPE